MKTKLLVILMLASLLTGTFLMAIQIKPACAAPDAIYVTPSPINKTPFDLSSFFDVYVDVQIVDLFGFDIKITWDNTLITFSSLDNSPLITIWPQGFFEPLNPSPPPGYQTGAGYVRYAAVATGGNGYTGTNHLFKLTFQVIKTCNFPLSTSIHFDTVKLSDHQWNSIIVTTTDGQYNMAFTVPDIEFVLINPHPNKPYEFCKTFEVEVHATHICAQMTDYDLTILFDAELLKFVDVDYWGTVFGPGMVSSTTGSVHVSLPAGTPHTGEDILLFALTFHVEFNDDIGHIWRTSNPGPLSAHISLDTTTGDLSFVEGYKYVSQSGDITLPSPVSLTINLIQGDVDCNGEVSVLDLRTVANFYDQTPGPAKYDLKTDVTIDIFDLVVVAVNFGYHKPDA